MSYQNDEHVEISANSRRLTPAPLVAEEAAPTYGSAAARSDLNVPLATSEHLGTTRQYWRDMILGVNDGLISTFLLVAGVSGGGLSSKDILLTAIAGAIAGAVSMCAGEYVATKSQNEVMHSEIALESQHVQMYRDDELEELRQLLDVIGIPQGHTLHCDMMAFYKKHPDALLKIMTALEFGVVDAEERSPITAGFFSFALFMTGSLPSVLPFAFATVEPVTGLAWAAACTVICLLLVGGVKAWATRGNCFTAAMENLIIAGFGGVGAYCIGAFFDHLLH